MKKFLLLGLIAIAVSSCVRKPIPCLTVDNENPKLGQEVTFSNCSDRYERLTMDFGDGSEEMTAGSTFSHAYSTAGTHTATITCYSKKDKKSEETSITISVPEPDVNEMKGSWTHYKTESFVDVFGFKISETYDENVKYEFKTDIVTINESYDFDLSVSGSNLNIGADIYQIEKLYNGKMILRETYEIGIEYDLLYLSKD